MTVAELIERLKGIDPNKGMGVIVWDRNEASEHMSDGVETFDSKWNKWSSPATSVAHDVHES